MIRAAAMAMVTAALAWALAGCDGFQAKPVDPKPIPFEDLKAKGQQKETGEKAGDRPVIETTVTGEATSPHKCYELYRQSIKARDFDACWALLSGPSKDAYEAAATDLKMRVINAAAPVGPDTELLGVLGLTRADADKLTGKMFMSGSMQRESIRNPERFDEITRTEFDHEALFGNKARVYLKIPGQREVEAMNLVREGALWRIEMRPARPTN